MPTGTSSFTLTRPAAPVPRRGSPRASTASVANRPPISVSNISEFERVGAAPAALRGEPNHDEYQCRRILTTRDGTPPRRRRIPAHGGDRADRLPHGRRSFRDAGDPAVARPGL